MFCSDIMVKLFENNGIEYVFGVPGGHLLKFFDSLSKSDKITSVLTKHESGASLMATGYSQVSSKISVCVGTVGPGATNLTTGVATAYMDSVPLFVLTAQVGTSIFGKGGLQEATGEGRTIDHVEIFNGITKYSSMVFSGEKLTESLNKALRTAICGRPGPVHLDILADAFQAEIEFNDVDSRVSCYRSGGDSELIRKAADCIISAKNPAILAGAGAIEAGQEIFEISKLLGIPVATTLRAKGLVSEDYDLSLGVVGIYGTNVANKYLRSDIDVLLAIGVSFHEFTTHAWDPKFQPKTCLIQVDIDPWEIGKNYKVDIGILGDSKLVLKDLLEELKKRSFSPLNKSAEITKMKSDREHFNDPKMNSKEIPMKPQRVMKSLRESLPRETIVFGDIGNTLTWLESYFQSYLPKTFFIGSGLASMGYGVAASIGGKIAAPDKPVVCICGDGDFHMHGMELATAVNYNIPVKWIIINNQKLAMISDLQDILFKGRRISSEFVNPDFIKFAESFGAIGYRVERPEEINSTVKEALHNEKPTIIDIPIDPKEFPSFDARAEAMVRAWGLKPSLYQKLKYIPEMLKRR